MDTLKTINLEDLPKYSDSSKLLGITHPIFEQLFKFFEKFERGYVYSVQVGDGEDLFSYIQPDLINIYNKYGIFFDEHIKTTVDCYCMDIPEDVFYKELKSPGHIEEYTNTFCKKYNISKSSIGFSVIRVDVDTQFELLNNIEDSLGILKSYLTCCSTYNIDNQGYYASMNNPIERLQKIPFYQSYTFINVAKYIAENGCLASTVYMRTIELTKELLTTISELGSENTVFYLFLDDYAIAPAYRNLLRKHRTYVMQTLYVYIAAYLTLRESFKFHIQPELDLYYDNAVKALSNKDSRFLGNYIEQLKNPVPYAIKKAYGNPAFLCQRVPDETDILKLTVSYCDVNFDGDNFVLESEAVHTSYLDAYNIEILDITKFYDLHTTDFIKGNSEMLRLHKILTKIQKCINKDLSRQPDFSLDCSNTLLFKLKNEYKIGYVSRIEANINYKLKCLTKGINYTCIKGFDLLEMSSLTDIRCYLDYETIFTGKLPDLTSFPALDETAEGFIIAALNATNESIASNCGLHYDSVGLWHIASILFRGLGVKKLIKCGIPAIGLRSEFLTFFGGPHPYSPTHLDKPTLRLNSNLWR